jgi:hypothetical protein
MADQGVNWLEPLSSWKILKKLPENPLKLGSKSFVTTFEKSMDPPPLIMSFYRKIINDPPEDP